ncbi:zinc-ribbon domain-containing protein [Chloroflexales bacterium ZM16-3]|nr:zinc-ribbon domain-containing protein [Chloroflexales bacterium ZM16-3]
MSDQRYCPSCGTQVSASERFCPSCGTRMDQPASAAPTLPFGQQSAAPTQALPPDQDLTLPPSFGTPPVGSPASFGVPTASMATPPKRGLPVWAIILIAVAVLGVIGCVASVAFISIFGTSTASATATPRPSGLGGGIVPVATREGDSPTDEIPAPTAANIPDAAPTTTGGGIIGGVNVDAAAARTAEAATAQVVAVTAQSEQASAALASILASGKQIFKDDFVDNRNRWFTGVFEDIETDTIEGGVFKVNWTAKGTSYELYEVRELTNFVADVDCLVYQGGTDGSCSLVFAQKTDVGFYKFELFDDYYRLFVVSSGSDPVDLAEGDPAGIVNPSNVNSLRVIKQGDQIQLFLNGTLLDIVSDSTYQIGKVGVSTNSYNESGGVEVWFDNFVIWELPS